MRINEILPLTENPVDVIHAPKYAIKIIKSGQMAGNIVDWEVTYYLKNPEVAVRDAESLMDFCTWPLRSDADFCNEQPTLFSGLNAKQAVIEKAKEIQIWCQKRKQQLANMGKHMEFFVKPIIWKGKT